MKHIYFIQSEKNPQKRYIGITSDVAARMKKHNEGGSKYTAPFLPWKLVLHLSMPDDHTAHAFERYLKTGSGRAFANRHFWPK